MRRSTLVTLGIFILLLAAVLLLRGRPVERGSSRLSFAGLDLDGVDRLTAVEGGKRVELQREGRAWTIAGTGALADGTVVTRALEGLKSVDTSEVVSTSLDRHQAFGVDPEKGLTVTAAAGSRTLADAVLGSSEAGSAYVRAVGRDTVYALPRSLRHLFPTDPARWARLRAFEVELDAVRRVEVSLEGEPTWAILPGDDDQAWRLEEESALPPGFRFDGRAAGALAASLANLRAKEVVAQPPDEAALGFEGEHDRFTLATDSGPVTLHLGAATADGDVYARVDGWDAVLAVRAHQASSLRKRLADLRDLTLMAFDPALATSLEVRAGSDRQRFVKDPAGPWVVDPQGPQPPADLELDPQGVERMVSLVRSLRATALADGVDAASAGLDDPSVSVTVGLGDQDEARLVFGAPAPADGPTELVYAGGNADAQVYTIARAQRDRFTRGWEAFRFVPPPPSGNPFANLDPETLRNLPPEVRESLERQMREQAEKERLLDQIRRQQGQPPGR